MAFILILSTVAITQLRVTGFFLKAVQVFFLFSLLESQAFLFLYMATYSPSQLRFVHLVCVMTDAKQCNFC